jgi:quinoprotein glucose dehydrogenase
MKSILLCFAICSSALAQSHLTWADYGGSPDAAQYSALKQIHRGNVGKLKIAWIYPTEDTNRYSFNPVVVDGVVYVLARNNAVVALNAVTGQEIWRHEADPDTKIITNRGINYWESKDRSDRRLLFAANHMLQAIDARTGKAIVSFGKAGRVNLKEGLGRDPQTIALVQSTTPGRVFEDLLILGSATNQGWGSAPGDIRAFDVRGGAVRWSFHTIPHEGELGYDTWPKDAWKSVGGANAWSEMTLDEKRGIVYIPTASPKYNFYGADRKGANLFGDCLLALDARTGKRLWHFQMVHHDIWDYDDATAPKLLTVQHDGKPVDIVAQVSKQAFVWVFNRVTGEPLWPIEERPVPKSDMPGEEAWPTQPFPVKPPPFARQKFTADDLGPDIADPAERARLKDEIQSARNEGMFTPPGLRNTVQMPGNNGGANWGGAAVDPTDGTLYVVSKDLPCMLKLVPAPKAGPNHYESGFGFMSTSAGVSPIAPPWTSMTAYDLNAGTIKWQVPLGKAQRSKAGPVVTAGGLIFVGTADKMVRALDEQTGKVLWERELSAPVEGIPAVYEVGGKEYIVFCVAGGNPGSSTKGGYVALTLE